jgi:hypothetical protein
MLQALIDDLSAHHVQIGVVVGGAPKRDVAQQSLIAALMKERAYVETVAAADPARADVIAALAGMTCRQRPSTYKPDIELRHGPLSGTVECIVRAIKNAVAYEWEQSLDGGNTWTYWPTSTQRARCSRTSHPKRPCTFVFVCSFAAPSTRTASPSGSS